MRAVPLPGLPHRPTTRWSDHNRAEFARLLVRFTDTLVDHLAAPNIPPHD
ncbi:MAG: hypothetical protein U0232_17495 [Thermomicrobiales bacterium]